MPLFFAYDINRFSNDVAQLLLAITLFITVLNSSSNAVHLFLCAQGLWPFKNISLTLS